MTTSPAAFPAVPVRVTTGDGTLIDVLLNLTTWRVYSALGPESAVPESIAAATWRADIDVTPTDTRTVTMGVLWNAKTPQPTIAAALAQTARAYVQWQCAPTPSNDRAIVPPLTPAIAASIRADMTVTLPFIGASGVLCPLADAEVISALTRWVPGYFAGWTPAP